MPLPRRVDVPGGLDIAGEHIPRGVSPRRQDLIACPALTYLMQVNVSMSVPSVHHNPAIWGADHNSFIPERWIKSDVDAKDMSSLLIPFSTGHRSCIGRNIAQTNIVKLAAALFRNYTLELCDPNETLIVDSLGISEKKGPLLCRVQKRT